MFWSRILIAYFDDEIVEGGTIPGQPLPQLWLALVQADPEEDRQAMLGFYQKAFPDVEMQEFANGFYAFDEVAREQWIEMEDVPPYEIAIEEGEEYFQTPFANGKGYADCFENGGMGVRQNYPQYDTETGEVVTLELAINLCRDANEEGPLPYLDGELAAISAYMAYTSRGNGVWKYSSPSSIAIS